MIAPQVSFDKFVHIFVPGMIATSGTWYLHRSFLSVYFPTIANDFTIDPSGLALRASILVVASIIVGVLIRSTSDAIIVGLFRDVSDSDKSTRWWRHWFRYCFRIFCFVHPDDARSSAIVRYLQSPRRKDFIILIEKWGLSNESRLNCPSELILVHQHITSRLRLTSEHLDRLIRENWQPVELSCNICLSMIILFFSSFIALITRGMISEVAQVHSFGNYFIFVFLIWVMTAATVQIVRRKFRHFCAQSITLAIHAQQLNDKE